MNIRTISFVALAATLAACASVPEQNTALDQARDRYAAAQGNTQVASRAKAELESAAESLRRAEQAFSDRASKETVDHLAYMTKQKVVIAEETASSLASQEIVASASAERDKLRLAMRTAEADAAHRDLASAEAGQERQAAALAAAEARERDLQRQLEELDAKKTDRGMVLTLGDVLFATDESELKGGAVSNLGKLASFLNEYQDRTVIIEGHTDSVGSEDYNLGLSQRRADAVRRYLMNQGVSANRLSATGMGKGSPVASNETATGRQQNRRVEVIIANESTASR
jgi:outer membrane protein OmpA-like peptidoglycan-associated protein